MGQQVTGYQPEESLYCVTATYERGTDAWVPCWDCEVIEVYNQGNQGAVNDPSQNSNNEPLCARLQDVTQPGKLGVAPCWLPNFLSEPTELVSDGCTTSLTGING